MSTSEWLLTVVAVAVVAWWLSKQHSAVTTSTTASFRGSTFDVGMYNAQTGQNFNLKL